MTRCVWLAVALLLSACGTAEECAGQYDLDCDGRVTAYEAPVCPECEVRCVDWPDGSQVPRCYLDGIERSTGDVGVMCSESDDPDDQPNLRTVCSGGVPTCQRTGEPRPGDLASPVCVDTTAR